MKNSKLSKIDYQIKKNQKFNIGKNQIKTTDINILLNRVRQKNKNKSKKKIILSISIITIILSIYILVFGN
jgi:hypothetical protein